MLYVAENGCPWNEKFCENASILLGTIKKYLHKYISTAGSWARAIIKIGYFRIIMMDN